jgi:hypothetical protein
MPAIPAFLLKKLYVKGSLKAIPDGFSFTIKNTLSSGTITKVSPLLIDSQKIGRERLTIAHRGSSRPATAIAPAHPLIFNLNDEAVVSVAGHDLAAGPHSLVVSITAAEVGELKIQVEEIL